EAGEEALATLEQAVGSKDFDVDFQGCTEVAAIGTVPAANARRLVPSHYTLAGDSTNALIVVRVAGCTSTSVDGKKATEGKVAQIGAVLSGPDATADINNYMLWYITDSGQLHGKLTAAGLAADNDQGLAYAFDAGKIAAMTSPSHAPRFAIGGPAEVP